MNGTRTVRAGTVQISYGFYELDTATGTWVRAPFVLSRCSACDRPHGNRPHLWVEDGNPDGLIYVADEDIPWLIERLGAAECRAAG